MKKIFGSLAVVAAAVALNFLLVASAAACSGWCGDEDWDYAANGGNNDLSQNQDFEGINFAGGGGLLSDGFQNFEMEGWAFGNAEYNSHAGQNLDAFTAFAIPGGTVWAAHTAEQNGALSVTWCGDISLQGNNRFDQYVVAGVNFNPNSISMGSATGGRLNMSATADSFGLASGDYSSLVSQSTGHDQTVALPGGYAHTDSYSHQEGHINVSVGEDD